MNSTTYTSVLGLGFGDCGKGRFVDALTRKWKAHTVVRFNGGAQAGHNVVEAGEPGRPLRHHTFSQFGSGTMIPGTGTVLLDPTVVHPTGLLVESVALSRLGIDDAFSRLTIDGRCRVITPYHQAAGRLREILRGEAAHETCGVGFGETVAHSPDHPEITLHYHHLSPRDGAGRRLARNILLAIRDHLLAKFAPACESGSPWFDSEEVQSLMDEALANRWLDLSEAVATRCPPAGAEKIHRHLTRPGHVLFEGAQGILLDEWRGFHPHTTWSSTGTHAVEQAAQEVGIGLPIQHLGVIRTYLTRHGPGPLPTHDSDLDALLPEPHNPGQGWQGPFRRGHPDAVLLRYALDVVGPLDGLLVSHLDVFSREVALHWCESYDWEAAAVKPRKIQRLPVGECGDLDHQSNLTALLMNSRPCYDQERMTNAAEFFNRLRSVTPLPVLMESATPVAGV